MIKHSLTMVLLSLFPLAAVCDAQPPALDAGQQEAILDKTLELVRTNYVLPEKTAAIDAALRSNQRAGKYAALTAPEAFLDAVNHDLQEAGNDRHLRIVFNPRIVAQLRREAEGGEAEVAPEFLAMLKASNFRLRRADTLDGNVGYFKLDNFVDLKFVKDPLVGAMNFLHNTSALILDLTDNGGGASETSDLLMSYFLPDGTKTGETWNRATQQTIPSILERSPEVDPMPDVPLYVLVSERTASAAEAVAYTLQQLQRAVVVGSRTKGMANAGVQLPIDDRLFVIVPTILVKNAVSGKNWEGTGVLPDLTVAPEKALDAAMAHALNTLAEREADESEKRRLQFVAEGFSARLSPQSPPANFEQACLGRYEDSQEIVSRDGSLWYVKSGLQRRLSFMKDQTFLVDGRSDYRLRFPLEDGRVARLSVLWFDDTSDVYDRVP